MNPLVKELTDMVSSWITYCEDTVVPAKTVKTYPNSKPWVSRHLEVLLNKKKQALNRVTSLSLGLYKRKSYRK